MTEIKDPLIICKSEQHELAFVYKSDMTDEELLTSVKALRLAVIQAAKEGAPITDDRSFRDIVQEIRRGPSV